MAREANMKTNRSKSTRIALLVCALIGPPASLSFAADDYPSRPVTIVVPFPPGASNDVLGRYEADVLARALHGSFVVEKKPGAGGGVGLSCGAQPAPRG